MLTCHFSSRRITFFDMATSKVAKENPILSDGLLYLNCSNLMVVETFPKAIVKFYVSFSSESMANQQLRVENCSLRLRANKASLFMVLEVPTGQIEKNKLPVQWQHAYNA